ncbi:MAG: hypothetical protein RL199_1302, partial [Pseudomonadota bacterium]
MPLPTTTPIRVIARSLLALTLVVAGCSRSAPAAKTAVAEPNVALAATSQRLTCEGGSGGNGGNGTASDAAAGAYIVDLGSATQTAANALKPYGLLYELVTSKQIPVIWAFKPTKTSRSEVDFTVGAKSYSTSAFVIPASFAQLAEVQTTITKWRSAGVVIDGPTTAAFTPPGYFKRITGFPSIAFDTDKGAIAQVYLTNAGIPTSGFPLKLPTDLSACEDVFVLPHADPTWATHGNLKPFVERGGYLWSACHAVSVIEGLDDPADADALPNLNFLSSTGLVNYDFHGKASAPYTQVAGTYGEPVMQFLDAPDAALESGSESVYLPSLGGGWRPTTKTLLIDETMGDVPSKSPGPAVKMAYGRAYGVSTNGFVFYEAGHTHAGTGAEFYAAQRAFLNFLLMSASEKSIAMSTNIPDYAVGGKSIAMTLNASSTSGTTFTYAWTSSCGGTFGSSTSATTTWTPPAATAADQKCLIRVTATDSCTRTASEVKYVTIPGGEPDMKVTLTPSTATPSLGGALNFSGTVEDLGGKVLTGSTLTLTLPGTSKYTVGSVSISTGSCTPGVNNVYSCTIGSVDICGVVTITATGTATLAGDLSATLSGASTATEPNLANNTATAAASIPVPDTTIGTKPSNPSNASTGDFTFSCDRSPCTFTCRIDGGAWASCASTWTTPTLGDGSHTVEVYATDSAGSADPSPASHTWTIKTINIAPTATVPAAQTLSEDGSLTFSGATLVSVADSDADGASEQLSVSVSSGSLTLASTTGLTFTTGSNGTALFIVTGTLANLNAALAGLVYAPTPNFNGSDTLSVVINDLGNTGNDGAKSDTKTVSLTVTPVNDAPVATVPGAQTTNEDTGITFSGPKLLAVADIDADPRDVNVTLSVTNGTLTLASSTALILTAGANGTASLTATGSLANLNAALNGLVYAPTVDFNGSDTLSLNINDQGNTGNGGTLFDTKTVAITVSPVNDAPVVSIPSPQSTSEDTPIVFSEKKLSVADLDAGTGTVRLTVSVQHGKLKLASAAPPSGLSGPATASPLTVVNGADNSGSFTVDGALDDINSALDGLTYTPEDNYNGADTLSLAINDQGNTGSGGALSDSKTLSLTITSVNDAPVLTVPGEQTTEEDKKLDIEALTVADPDSGTSELGLVLAVSHGTLKLGSTSGVTVDEPNGASSLTLSGTVSNLNVALASLTYMPEANFNGTETLTVDVDDLGNTGSGGPLKDSKNVVIHVLAVDDAP